MLRSTLALMLCLFFSPVFADSAAPDPSGTDLTDWWVASNVAGSSVNIAQQGDTLFIGWYVYDQFNQPTWVYGVGKMTGARADLDLFTARGPFLGPQTQVVSDKVGTATIDFVDFATLHFAYSTTTQGTGALDLSRFSFNAPLLGDGYRRRLGIVHIRWVEIMAAPGAPSESDFNFLYETQHGVSVSPGTISISDGLCTYVGPLRQAGNHFEASGSFSCTGQPLWSTTTAFSGATGNWSVRSGRIETDGSMHMSMHLEFPGVAIEADINIEPYTFF